MNLSIGRAALVTSILSLFTMCTPALADLRDGGLEVGPYLFHAHFDSDSGVENSEGLGGRLGILFTKEHELEFSVDYVETEDDFGGPFDVSLTTFKAGYVYNIAPRAPVVPLLTTGVGLQRLEISEATFFGDVEIQDETDPLVFVGFGLRFFFGHTFNIRTDAQAVAVFPDEDGSDDALVDGIFTVGVGWVLGGHR
ncbi:MAG TPA: outer membrane beta-barrel protein [Candidatus Polarisedimenticolia bacterium]|nr:outer membrane beta-barrel protein [Candidatus Polarisedimenticolia bacterium]